MEDRKFRVSWKFREEPTTVYSGDNVLTITEANYAAKWGNEQFPNIIHWVESVEKPQEAN